MNREVECIPVAVFEMGNVSQVPTISRTLCTPLEIGRSPDDSQVPVSVVGVNML